MVRLPNGKIIEYNNNLYDNQLSPIMTLNSSNAKYITLTLTNTFNWTSSSYPNYEYLDYAFPYNITFPVGCFLYSIIVTNNIIITSPSHYRKTASVRGDIAQKTLNSTSADYIANVNPIETSQTITNTQSATYLVYNNNTLSNIYDTEFSANQIKNNTPIYYLTCEAPADSYAPQVTFNINTTINILYYYIA